VIIKSKTASGYRQWSWLLRVFLLHIVTHLRSLIQDIVHSVGIVHGDLTGVRYSYFSFPMV
jgi:hypothetical protein